MNENKMRFVIASLFAIMVGCAFFFLIFTYEEVQVTNRLLSQAEMYKHIDFENGSGINGLYFPIDNEEYYCVYLKERELNDIQETDRHEYCHFLIDLDEEGHFCKNE